MSKDNGTEPVERLHSEACLGAGSLWKANGVRHLPGGTTVCAVCELPIYADPRPRRAISQ